MNHLQKVSGLLLMFLLASVPMLAVVGPTGVVVQQEQIAAQSLNAKQLRKKKRLERKAERLKKRLESKRAAIDLLDDFNFRLGVICLLAALALALLGGLLSFGLFNILGGLFAIGGVVLIILALVQL
ncbi:MAG: hypothetical protein MRY78_16835 [Saprospiraceae bacterium]|nr:hypothetical protein [Saprospiraceae bacterium]